MIDDYYIEKCLKNGYTKEQAYGRIFARGISEFVLDKNIKDLILQEEAQEELTKALKEIELYGITEIVYDKRVVTITSSRPGVLIGVKGSNIYALEEHLKKYGERYGLEVISVKLKEDLAPLVDDLHFSMRCLANHIDPEHEDDFEEPEWDSE